MIGERTLSTARDEQPVSQVDTPQPAPHSESWLAAIGRGWDRAEAWFAHGRRADAMALVFLIAATAIVTVGLSRDDEWLKRTDLLTAYLPWYDYLGERLRNFDIPGWSPFQASGLPFAGDPQSGWMYAPAMLWFSILPPLAAIKAMAATQILITAISTYLFARLLGLRVVAALTGATALAFGAHVYHNTWCCTIWSQATPWIPTALLGVEIGLRPWALRHRVGGWALAGIAISQLFAGWIGQGAYNGLAIIGAYTLYRTLISPRTAGDPVRRRLVALLVSGSVILLLGLGLAAAGALPRFEASRSSPISGVAYDVLEARGGDSGWEPEHLLHQLTDTWSQASGEYESNRRYYQGAFALSLALVAPIMGRRRFATPFFFAVAALMLTLVSKETPVHRLFYQLPEFENLHAHSPFRLLGFSFFFVSMLAAITVQAVRDPGRRAWLIPVALIPPAILFWVDDYITGLTRHVGWPVLFGAVMVGLLLMAAGFVSIATRRLTDQQRARLLSVIALLLFLGVVWDPMARQMIEDDFTDHATDARLAARIEESLSDGEAGSAAAFLQQQFADAGMPFRYFGYDGIWLRTLDASTQRIITYQGRLEDPDIRALLVSARATVLGLHDIQGYNPAQYQPYIDYLTIANAGVEQDYHDANILRTGLGSPLIDLLGVRYIVVPRDVPPGRPDLLRLSQRYPTVFVDERVRILENPNALPRAWLVRNAEVGTIESFNEGLLAGAIDPRETAIVDEPIPELDGLPATDTNTIVFEHFGADKIDLTVTSETGGLLVLSELDAPGWQAYLDGERVDTHTVNGIFRGVVVPPGESEVEFRYELRSLRIGLAISAVAAGAVIAIAFWNLFPWLRKHRRLGRSA